MSKHPALQATTATGPVSAGAAQLVTRILDEDLDLDDALHGVAAHLLGEASVEIVTIVLTTFSPEDPTGWVQLGGRAWVREWTRPGSTPWTPAGCTG